MKPNAFISFNRFRKLKYLFSKEEIIIHFIGILQKKRNFDEKLNNLAKEVQIHGLSLVVFTLEDLSYEEGLVLGRAYNDGEWISKEVPIPLFIDVEPDVFTAQKNREELKKLRKLTTLSATVRYPLPRSRYKKYFKPSSYFYEQVIFREKVQSIEEIQEILKNEESIRITPVGRAKDRTIVIQEGDTLKLYRERDTILLGNDISVLTPYLGQKGFFVEKFIPSKINSLKETQGYAHFEKNGEGKWVLVNTNIHSTINLEEFYNDSYGENALELFQTAEEELYRFAHAVEISRKREFIDLVIHFSIDSEGKMYFRHVTKNINLKENIEKVVKLRAAYYAFKAESLGVFQIESSEDLIRQRIENREIEEALIDFQEKEEEKQRLIEQGILKPEKKEWTLFSVLIIIAIIFALFRYVLRIFI